MTPEIAQESLDAGNMIFWGAVGPRQGLWLPCGVIVAEHTVNNVDCVGVRLWLYHDTDHVAALEMYSKELEASGVTNSATHVSCLLCFLFESLYENMFKGNPPMS